MFRFLKRPDCVVSAPVKALITPQLHADDADFWVLSSER